MKTTSAFIWSTIITILIIVAANILAIEYRIKREKEEREKEEHEKEGCICPPSNNYIK